MPEADLMEHTVALLDGRYELQERIGEGGMADVHRARDLVLERTVAVKVLRAGSDVLSSSARARNEMALLAGLSHPSLVTLLDARLSPGRASYLVMELVPGETLAEHLRRGPLDTRNAAQLATDLASGLQAVHAAGVVHRDVKPSNVLIAPPSQPGAPFHAKLTDFGIAALVDGTRVTAPGVVVGTAAYFAPEQLRGQASTPAVDIYALGLLLLESLTGERAYPEATGFEAVLARLVAPPHIPESLPSGWRQLLHKMTAMEAAHRPNAEEVARAISGLAATADAVTKRSHQPRRSRMARVAAAIATTAAAVALTIASMGPAPTTEQPAPTVLTDVLHMTAPSARTEGTTAVSSMESARTANVATDGSASAGDPGARTENVVPAASTTAATKRNAHAATRGPSSHAQKEKAQQKPRPAHKSPHAHNPHDSQEDDQGE